MLGRNHARSARRPSQRFIRARVDSRMKTSRLALFAFALCVGRLSLAGDVRTAEQVVREYAATWNAGASTDFFALQAPDIRKFALDAATGEFRLTTSGLDAVKQKYAPLFAKPARVKVEIVSLTTLGEMVVTRDHVTNDAEKYVSNEMTMYQVREGQIVGIWYLGRAIG